MVSHTSSAVLFVLLVSDDYWLGAVALIESISQNSELKTDVHRFLIFGDPPASFRDWADNREQRIDLRSLEDLGQFEPLMDQDKGDRMVVALQKLQLFQPRVWVDLIEEQLLNEKLVYIDADLICLNPLNELMDLKPPALAADRGCEASTAPGSALDRCVDLNTGLMVFQPDETLYEGFLNVYRDRPWDFTSLGDQDVINACLERDSLTLLDGVWNFSKRRLAILSPQRRCEALGLIRFLHYVGLKPWDDASHLRTIGDCGHDEGEKIWWKYFQDSGYQQFDSTLPKRRQIMRGRWLASWTRRRLWKERLSNLRCSIVWRLKQALVRPGIGRRIAAKLHRDLDASLFPKVVDERSLAKEKTQKILDYLFPEPVVMSGPFTGLRYPSLQSHGSTFAPKLLGCYEAELHAVIEEAIAAKPNHVVDIGSAEGYYAVGMAMRLPKAHIIAADTSKLARELCRFMAEANGVAYRIEHRDEMSEADLLSLPADQPGLLICDCEGGERALLTEAVFNHLRRWTLIVEMHEFVELGIERDIQAMARQTHAVQTIESIDDYHRINKLAPPPIKNLRPWERYHLMREGRPIAMNWIVATPNLSNQPRG